MIYNWVFRESFKSAGFFFLLCSIFIIFFSGSKYLWLHYFEMSIPYDSFKIESKNDGFSLSWITMFQKYFVPSPVDKSNFYHRHGQCTSLSVSPVYRKKMQHVHFLHFFFFIFLKKEKNRNAVIFKLEMVDSCKWIGEKYSVEKEGVKNSIHPAN